MRKGRRNSSKRKLMRKGRRNISKKKPIAHMMLTGASIREGALAEE
jgi:hypothetical protein